MQFELRPQVVPGERSRPGAVSERACLWTAAVLWPAVCREGVLFSISDFAILLVAPTEIGKHGVDWQDSQGRPLLARSGVKKALDLALDESFKSRCKIGLFLNSASQVAKNPC